VSTFRNTPRAEADLEEITDSFAERNPDAGIRLLDAITARCRQLANQPRQGRRRDDLSPGVRSVVVRGSVIFYRPGASGVEILRVLHGARDMKPDLFEE
jgi:toxin ParE1/3/4